MAQSTDQHAQPEPLSERALDTDADRDELLRALSVTIEEQATVIDQQAAALEETEARVKALTERCDRLEKRVETSESAASHHADHAPTVESTATIHALARENHDLRSRVSKTETKDSCFMNDILDVYDELDGLHEQVAATTGEATAVSPEMTPIERLARIGEEGTGIEMTPSIERAVTIYNHWKEWSTVAQQGRTIRTGLKTLLRTATGEKLAWRQVNRAANALEELSKGEIQFRNTTKHGNVLIEPATGIEVNNCHSSSVAST